MISLKRITGHLIVATFISTINQGIANASPLNSSNCDPIARDYSSGKIICRGDFVGTSAGHNLLCFLNQKWLSLTHFSVFGDMCVPPKTLGRGTIKRCTQFNEGNPGCGIDKGEGVTDKPEIIAPYTNTLLNGRPYLSWAKVSTATSYLVQVKGRNVAWSRETNSTNLDYPAKEPPLAPGEVYQVITTAFKDSGPLKSDTTALTMLPLPEAQQVQKQVSNVKAQGYSSDEIAYLDLDVIYRSHNLYTETINSLLSRVKQGTQNPELYRVLANRYCQVGLPQLARKYYNLGYLLAQQQKNQNALNKIRAAIAQITTSSPQE